MLHVPLSLALLSGVPATAAPGSRPAAEFVVLSTLEPTFAVADQRIAALAEGGRNELFVLGIEGQVRSYRFTERALREHSAVTIADPRQAAVALARLDPSEPAGAMFVVGPRGVECFSAGADGRLAETARLLAPKARLRLRTGQPRFAPLAQDVNGDGRTDFVLLGSSEALDLWVRSTPKEGESVPVFTKATSVHVEVSQRRRLDADDLSDELRSSITIPGLSLHDVNGDHRADLLIEDGDRHAFHLVRADGTIPSAPDVSVDLEVFRDTTPDAEIVPGRTVALDERLWQMRDLDADGIEDYVIAHKRKVWVFHGRSAGPQFTEPSTILKSSEDVTATTLIDLDADQRPDLLLVKVHVPSTAAMLRGLVASFDIDVSVIGYRNVDGRKFDLEPKWKSLLALRVPAILSIVRNPESYLERFEQAGKKIRRPIEGDFDGDTSSDVALLSEEANTLAVWRGDPKSVRGLAESDETILKRLLFEEKDKVWDFDRLIGWLAGYGEARTKVLTGSRPADMNVDLARAGLVFEDAESSDLDGDGAYELLVRYRRVGTPGSKVFEVLGMR